MSIQPFAIAFFLPFTYAIGYIGYNFLPWVYPMVFVVTLRIRLCSQLVEGLPLDCGEKGNMCPTLETAYLSPEF